MYRVFIVFFFIFFINTVLASRDLEKDELVINLLNKSANKRTFINDKKSIKLEESGFIRGYKKDNEYIEDVFTRIAVDYDEDIIYAYTSYSNPKFVKFNAAEFANADSAMIPLNISNRHIGYGPNDLPSGYITDMSYDSETKKLYIIEPSGYNVFVYDTDLNEIDRIKLDFRPYKFSIYKKKMYISKYDGGLFDNYSVAELDLETKNIRNIFPTERLSGEENISYTGRTTVFIDKINKNQYFLSRWRPDYKIFICTENKVSKVFSSPRLNDPIKGFPKPKYFIDDGDRRIRGVLAYKDVYFDLGTKLLFTLSTGGSCSLAKEYNLSNYISIYDLDGNTLCEYKLFNGEIAFGGESGQLLYDYKREILYFVNEEEIIKYKVIK